MGVNDDQLSPGEQDELRQRLVLGARRIKPAGAHRRAIVSTTVAVAVVAALSVGAIGAANFLRLGNESEPVATPTPTPSATPSATSSTTSSPRPTPTPTLTEPAPVPAVLPFGGDCGQVTGLDQSGLEADEGQAMPYLWDLTNHAASAALLGGVTCSWPSDDPELGYAAVSVFPAAVITPEIADKWTDTTCRGAFYVCETGRFVADFWIGAGLSRSVSAETEMTEDERTGLATRLNAMIDAVAANTLGETAQAASREAGWWTVPPCSSLDGTVSANVPVALETGFPGDAIPEGMDWETLVDAGVMDWCSWYGYAGQDSVIVEIYEQPGIGAPTTDEVAATEFRPADVVGAEEGWIYQNAESLDSFTVVAVSGPNRLTVHFAGAADEQAARDLAAALLDDLNAR
ncbi:hypothetical protein [Microbacterium sp. P05]|uniref:hypothetical protein n=1 Tax=Microbacterium sp. P05 TaxID=3366948 RepID=UPI0037451D2A